ncbi:Metal tolerance protein 4 [Senna tora]|uniref:Metal tolerance protein 4 n=1 Tax=Senna tora TaxID=362788 RepID=A0A835CDX3_9FABA|nr:Metal tolerance protein 4 [Senna tora]
MHGLGVDGRENLRRQLGHKFRPQRVIRVPAGAAPGATLPQQRRTRIRTRFTIHEWRQDTGRKAFVASA